MPADQNAGGFERIDGPAHSPHADSEALCKRTEGRNFFSGPPFAAHNGLTDGERNLKTFAGCGHDKILRMQLSA
jgi:hypothetical protein